MNGPEHYVEAERLLTAAISWDRDDHQIRIDAVVTAVAQVHATLALAAGQAGQTLGMPGVPSREWSEATS